MISYDGTYQSVYLTLKQYHDAIETAKKQISELTLKCQQECDIWSERVQNKLSENAENTRKVEAFINIARAHAGSCVTARTANAYDYNRLSQLAVQINNASKSDWYAEQLYNEATAQKIYLEEEKKRLNMSVSTKKVELVRQSQEEEKRLRKRIESIEAEINAYYCTSEFVTFVSMLKQDALLFRDGAYEGAKHSDYISIGSCYKPLYTSGNSVNAMVQAADGMFDSRTQTIGVPFSLDMKRGTSLLIEYTNESEEALLSGIQNLILNVARYYGEEMKQIGMIDPVRFNNSCLGILAPLSMGKNSFIDTIPLSMEECRRRMDGIMKQLNDEGREDWENRSKVPNRLFIFHNYPQAYDSTVVNQIVQLCVNAETYGVIVVLTNNVTNESSFTMEQLSYVKSRAINILWDKGQWKVLLSGGIRENFRWYKAPTKLPDNIRNKYIEGRKTADFSTDYLQRVGMQGMRKNPKGTRLLSKIPYGVDKEGNLHYLDFENSNFASFICGAARSGKSTLLHTLITGIIQNNHPDDVELWFVDFKMTEFSRYVEHLPPHVRYIILDESPELVYDIIDRLTEILQKRQNIFKGKWQKLSEVPADKYMPALLVIIDEFSVMSQILADSATNGTENYSLKLQTLLAKGAALGMHFIFASQGFTTGTRGLNDFSKKQVQQRIAMKTDYNEIRETLELKTTSDEDRMLMEQLPVHHALVRISEDEFGNHLKFLKVLYISDYAAQERLIKQINAEYQPTLRYDALNDKTFINKKPMIVDGNHFASYKSKKDEMIKQITNTQEEWGEESGTLLFLGEPRRMLPVYPIEIVNGFCENILLVGAMKEKMPITSILISLWKSLRLQKISMDIWMNNKNPIYQQFTYGCKCMADEVARDLEEVCGRIKNMKKAIQNKVEENKFFVLLGFDSLLMDMSYLQTTHSGFSEEISIGGDWLNFRHNSNREGTSLLEILEMEEPIDESEIVEESMEILNKTAEKRVDAEQEECVYDAREDLKYILTHGPRMGYHFVVLFHTAGEFRQCKMDETLFKHKILFRTVRGDARDFVSSHDSEIVSELEDHYYRYSDGLKSVSMRPYLHPGLSWEGWQMDFDGNIGNVTEEDEYLL